ncbi:hypothetical protein JL720_17389 [Aureococcus anophagefferens]|nr:hypothetical protein JL720_17389 [Aureococcus anophagefferens]
MGDQEGGDCSDRKCPYRVAWSASPDRDGNIHTRAECAGVGICGRSTGDCELRLRTGLRHQACRATLRPRRLHLRRGRAFGTVWGDYYTAKSNSLTGLGTDRSAFGARRSSVGLGQGQTVVREPGYTDIDCSRRMCPKGNDVLDERLNLVTALSTRSRRGAHPPAGEAGDGITYNPSGEVCNGGFGDSTNGGWYGKYESNNWARGATSIASTARTATTGTGLLQGLPQQVLALTFTSKMNQSYDQAPPASPRPTTLPSPAPGYKPSPSPDSPAVRAPSPMPSPDAFGLRFRRPASPAVSPGVLTESPTTAPTTTPTTAPTSASNPTPKPTPTSSCADSASWFEEEQNDCAWVAEDAESRCSKKDDDDVKAKSACPRACGKCDDDAEEEDEAEPASRAIPPGSRRRAVTTAASPTSASWYYKKADRDCSWIADKPKRCDKADEYGVDASVACALTCDACDADARQRHAPRRAAEAPGARAGERRGDPLRGR